ncbi:hypothetical protein FPHOBKDP_00097 [Listeria phage LPJP1]|nr:hypothetical protein FPHOBKDP_00097 [Listeria phage LPJP1]
MGIAEKFNDARKKKKDDKGKDGKEQSKFKDFLDATPLGMVMNMGSEYSKLMSSRVGQDMKKNPKSFAKSLFSLTPVAALYNMAENGFDPNKPSKSVWGKISNFFSSITDKLKDIVKGLGSVNANAASTGGNSGGSGAGKNLSKDFGSVARFYETGKEDFSGAGYISSGVGDAGGKSYGIYQLSSTKGSLANFVKWLGSAHPDLAKKLSGSPGSSSFDASWKKLGQNKAFGEAQQEYFQKDFYNPGLAKINKALGTDLSGRSRGIQELILSASVQHGAGGATSLFKRALARKNISKLSDNQIIDLVQKQRLSQYMGQYAGTNQEAGLRRRAKEEGAKLKDLTNQKVSSSKENKNTSKDIGSNLGSVMSNNGSSDKTDGQSIGYKDVEYAKKYIGTPYSMGPSSGLGKTKTFDCSSLVMNAYNSVGKKLPRTSREQYKATKRIKKDELSIGDLIFFSANPDGSISHVGIYISEGKMINAESSKGVNIRSDALNMPADWFGRLVGFGRVSGNTGGTADGSAELSGTGEVNEETEEQKSRANFKLTEEEKKAIGDRINSKYAKEYGLKGDNEDFSNGKDGSNSTSATAEPSKSGGSKG